MSLAFLKDRFVYWREWEPNPVLLRELRQATRSQSLVGALLLLLAILFLTMLALVARHSVLASDIHLGKQLCRAILVILSAATFLFLPLYAGLRMAAERSESDMDLLFFTTLPAGKIVRGKLGCGAYLAALFFSICTPFMLLATLLKGVDIPSILVVAVCLFAADCLAIQGALCLACLPLQASIKIVAGLLFVFFLAAAGCGLVWFWFELLDEGVGGSIGYWIGVATTLALIAGAIRVLHSMTVKLITLDNRPRGYFNEILRTTAPCSK